MKKTLVILTFLMVFISVLEGPDGPNNRNLNYYDNVIHQGYIEHINSDTQKLEICLWYGWWQCYSRWIQVTPQTIIQSGGETLTFSDFSYGQTVAFQYEPDTDGDYVYIATFINVIKGEAYGP